MAVAQSYGIAKDKPSNDKSITYNEKLREIIKLFVPIQYRYSKFIMSSKEENQNWEYTSSTVVLVLEHIIGGNLGNFKVCWHQYVRSFREYKIGFTD